MQKIQTQTKGRIHHIDVFSGLLMLIVILGHSIGCTTDPLNRFILSFHMPAFFILSGMCFKPKNSDFDIINVMKRKCRDLLWPYIVLSLVGVVLYWLLLAGTSKDKGATVWQTLVGIVWPDSHVGRMVTLGFCFVYDLIWITFLYILSMYIGRFICVIMSTVLFFALYYSNLHIYFSSEIIRISAGFMLFMLGDLFSVNMQKLRLNTNDNLTGGNVDIFVNINS